LYLPGDPELLNYLGLVLIDQGRYDEAISPLEEAVSKKPYAAPFYLNLGTAYALYGDFPKAAVNFEQATSLSPQYLLALQNLGLAQINAHEFRQAVPPLLAALEIYPANGVVWINLGISLSELGYLDDGLFALEHALTYSLSSSDRTLAEEAVISVKKTLQESSSHRLDPEIRDQIDALSVAPAIIQPAVLIPSLHAPKSESDLLYLEFPFSFNGVDEHIELVVSRELYLEAQGSYKRPLWNDFSASASEPAGLLYHAFIHDPVQKPIIEALSAELHRVMEHHADSSYLELIATFIHTLAQANHIELRYPVESLVDKAADCDDRTILAAALLLEDGYDVVILSFEDHAVLGVRSYEWDIPLREYRKSGYSAIDLTSYGDLGTVASIYDTPSLSVIQVQSAV
jgi:tetratricopeptide (TPR) repeat protein